jgi:hypothetical protein
LVSKSRILRKMKDKVNKDTKIIELIGNTFEVKLSKKTPPITQYQRLGTKPKLKEKSKTYIKIRLGLNRILKLGIKTIEIKITKAKTKKEGIFIY